MHVMGDKTFNGMRQKFATELRVTVLVKSISEFLQLDTGTATEVGAMIGKYSEEANVKGKTIGARTTNVKICCRVVDVIFAEYHK
jgi:hypothetical protein